MRSLDLAHIVGISKEEVVDLVSHVEGLHRSLGLQAGVYIVICVTADMEIPRYFLHSKITPQPAASLLLETFPGDL